MSCDVEWAMILDYTAHVTVFVILQFQLQGMLAEYTSKVIVLWRHHHSKAEQPHQK